MNYLVTGGAGFIGSHLVDRLLHDDNQVTVIDGHSDTVVVIDNMYAGKYENLPKDPRLTVYDADILGDVGYLFKDIDIVFHLAALTRPQWSIQYPFQTNQVNVNGTIKVLQHSVEHKIKRFIFMSSSNLYGEQTMYPTAEIAKPNPMNTYALTKLVGELYCKMFEQLHGLEWNAIRPFNAYGTRMPLTGIYTSAVATFIDALKNDKPVEMFGDGNQKRDFIYIDDIIDQMILMASSKVHGEVFNCGSGENHSINELLDIISSILGKEPRPHRNPSQFEPSQTLASITKAEKLLGWRPKIGLKEGLRRTIHG